MDGDGERGEDSILASPRCADDHPLTVGRHVALLQDGHRRYSLSARSVHLDPDQRVALPQRPEDQLSGSAEGHLIAAAGDQARWRAPVEGRQPNLRCSTAVRGREGHVLLVARNHVVGDGLARQHACRSSPTRGPPSASQLTLESSPMPPATSPAQQDRTHVCHPGKSGEPRRSLPTRSPARRPRRESRRRSDACRPMSRWTGRPAPAQCLPPRAGRR